jgi:hypothetical protein
VDCREMCGPQPRHASLNGGEPRSTSGSLAMLAAMRRASSRVNSLVADRRPGRRSPASTRSTSAILASCAIASRLMLVANR